MIYASDFLFSSLNSLRPRFSQFLCVCFFLFISDGKYNLMLASREALHGNFIYKHTNTNGHKNPLVRIILLSHTTHVMSITLMHKWWDLHFKIDHKWQSFVLRILIIFRFCARKQLRPGLRNLPGIVTPLSS